MLKTLGEKKRYIILLLLLFVTVFLLYLPLFGSFFQHDEWIAFGDLLSKNSSFFSTFIGFFAPNRDHYVPIFQIIFFAYLKLFKFNFGFYAFFSILLHLIVVYLVYVFSLRVFKKRLLAFLASTFFALSSSIYQATSWVWYDINSHYSSVFALLSLIFFWDFLKEEKIKKLYLSLLFLVVSLFIKEVAVGFIALYLLAIILFKGLRIKKHIGCYLPVIITGVFYLCLRASMYIIPGAYGDWGTVFQLQSLGNLILNLITFPSKVLLQSIFPPRVFLTISGWLTLLFPSNLTGIFGTTQFGTFVEQKTLQYLSLAVLIIIVFLIYRLWSLRKNLYLNKVIVFGLVFVILNSFIYAFSPGKVGLDAIVDSRNLYFPSIGAAVFLISFLTLVTKNSSTKLVFLILPLILWQAFSLRTEILKVYEVGSVRKGILYQIKKDYPALSKKVIFYTESNTTYYGMPETEKILPFEVGLGRTLLSWYEPDEKYPKSFFENKFLWAVTDQGYFEDGSRGFGYFRNFDLLTKVVEEKKINVNSIIAFRFDSKTNFLTDISEELRNKMLQLPIKYESEK